ncbi:HNH endonuclease [Pseudomonas monteilii]|uniref:HNH endonuclease n=1 Tax=Pseudomonas monteilii TaxID=76759 RepID=UPI001E40293E|nr:HNH endonuclease [Pseudomonas monteilii]MCE0876929.1 HNH endonuclease [Pseudomonas monteilii]MCE0981603.1 HNH endonuclease [Pseudomonas monteilii]MCE1015702.1 HNH endonuclease [Pseudomonas monteilii]MCE1044093.1 HNH endonuclease [Pseudomonas monteilii]WJN91126.1 HNH endonuclease [Pseudomonas monteilii]
MICAYCKQEASATREHVIPAFIYRFQKQFEASVIGWNEVARKMVGGEHQVKDVCETCNSGVLSSLDAYGKELLDSNGFLTQNYTKLSADLTYDYDQLARWLLKISFNSTRSDRGHSHLFDRFIPFILNGAPAPSKANFAIVATLAAPVSIGELNGDYEVLQSLAGQTGRVNPFFMRIAYGPETYNTFTLRVVMFGPLIFFLLMYRPGLSAGSIANETKRLFKHVAALTLLQPGRTKAFLNAGPTSWLEYYAPQVMRVKKLRAYNP